MKKIITGILIAAAVLVSCDKESELEIYDGEAIGIAQSSFQTSVAATGTTLTIPITATSQSDAARSFNAEVISADNEAEFTLGSVNIPANSFDGTLDVVFDFAAITGDDGELKNVQIGLPAGQGVDVFGTVASIDYFREVVCNDLELEIVTDFWASETGFSITDDTTGAVVFSFGAGTYSNGEQTITIPITLPDGCYTATITDAYADGLVSGGVTGSYALTCSIIDHFSGPGNFGASATGSFCVNQ